jgi:large subunit ribosomal protein L20
MRITRGVTSRRRHNKLLKAAKGYRGRRNSTVKMAKQAIMKAGQNSYRDRRRKKREFRRLWIIRLNAALRERGFMYSRFIRAAEDKKVAIDRKILSELAINEPGAFGKVVDTVMSSTK